MYELRGYKPTIRSAGTSDRRSNLDSRKDRSEDRRHAQRRGVITAPKAKAQVEVYATRQMANFEPLVTQQRPSWREGKVRQSAHGTIPPYNTGDKNWKYNNDYVDASDVYRHSKWLAWMERRLLLAKKLLNKDDGVLIVTIDEKEYLRLGLLLEQVFPIAKGDKDKEYRGRVSIQMVSTVINPKGSRRDNEFSRCDEYIFFVSLGKASVKSIGRSMLQETKTSKAATIRWKGTLRSASNNGRRVDRRNLFYPMLSDEVSGRFHGVGLVLDLDEDRHDYLPPKGTVAVWPIGEGGIELTWSLKPETLLQNLPHDVELEAQLDRLSAGMQVGTIIEEILQLLYDLGGTDASLTFEAFVHVPDGIDERTSGVIKENAKTLGVTIDIR